ncbi:Uncharacterised protein [Vibrio cholerae]|nr:Uncharacterised protein [Vibrio cholerae]
MASIACNTACSDEHFRICSCRSINSWKVRSLFAASDIKAVISSSRESIRWR